MTIKTTAELHRAQLELINKADTLQGKVDAENRLLSEEEKTEMDGFYAQVDAITADIEDRKARAARAAAVRETVDTGDRLVIPGATIDSIRAPAGTETEKKNLGFKYFGEYANAVRQASMPNFRGDLDQRLVNAAPATFGGEGTDADGGYAVPPGFQEQIFSRIQGEENLAARCFQLPASSNQVVLPLDEDEAWVQDTAGVTTHMSSEAGVAEGIAMTPTKPRLTTRTIVTYKLSVLVPVVEELLEDVPAMGAFVQRKAPEKIIAETNRQLIHGDGATTDGQLNGLISAGNGAKIPVADAGANGNTDIAYADVVNMYTRLYAPYRNNAVWLMHQALEPSLYSMVLAGASSDVPVYLPANGIAGRPFSTLMGLPVIFTQAASAPGVDGDVILTNLGEYVYVTKGGVDFQTSIHLYFDAYATAFRWVLRHGGNSWLTAPITARSADAGHTLSSTVFLDRTAA